MLKLEIAVDDKKKERRRKEQTDEEERNLCGITKLTTRVQVISIFLMLFTQFSCLFSDIISININK